MMSMMEPGFFGRAAASVSAAIRLAALPGAVSLLCVLAAAGAADAHIISGGTGGFGAGFKHPLTGYDHLLAMFSVGLWGAQMGGRRVWALPVAFPLIMVVGGIAGIAGIPFPGVETGIALSILVLGLAIAAVWSPPEWLALALISAFAVCHGYAHGAELPLAADPADYAIGFVVATGLIHIAGVGVGIGLSRIGSGTVSRVLGGLIAFAGMSYLVA